MPAEFQEPAWREAYIVRTRPWHASDLDVGGAGKPSLADVDRFIEERRAFRLKHCGAYLYPRFQFDVLGRPLPVLSELIDAIATAELTSWRLAYLLDTPNDFFGAVPGREEGLRRAPPVDFFISAPARVLKVVRREIGLTDDI